MSAKNTSQSDLIHDFQADLSALLSTLEQVEKFFNEDPDFCERAIALANKKRDKLFGQWEELKARFKAEERRI